MRILIGFCLLSLQLLCVPASEGATLPEVGTVASNQLDMLGKHVSLPPGRWRVVSTGYGHVTDSLPGAYGAIAALLLVQAGDQSDGAFLLLQTNVLPVRSGWGQPPECNLPDALFKDITPSRNLHNACSFVLATHPRYLLRSATPAVTNTKQVTDALPKWALVLGLRISDRRDVLDMRYGIVPRTLSPRGWFVARDMMDRAHRELITRLGDWTLSARKVGFAALRDPIAEVPPLPQLPLRDGVILAAPPPPEASALRLGLYKLGTYRIASTVSSLIMGTIVTGNFYDGVILSFWQGLTHSAVYLGNELAWEWPRATPNTPFIANPSEMPLSEAPAVSAIVPQTKLAARTAIMPSLVAAGTTVPPDSDQAHVRSLLPIDGKQVPLPDGTWTVLVREPDNGSTGAILGRLDGGNLSGLVVVHTNPTPTTAIFGTSSQCRRSDIAFAVIRYDTPSDGYCVYSKRVAPDAHADRSSMWGKALAILNESGIKLPPDLMMVGVRARTQENYLDTRYYFLPDPVLMHRDMEDTGLTPDPINALQAWADLAQESIELGVRGRLQADSEALPWPWQTNTVKDALVWQARGPLEDLAANGVLDDTELLHQRAQADHSLVEREEERWSVWERSAYKVATYRAASFVDTAAVAVIATGSPGLALNYAGIMAVFKPVVAYANEMFWAQSAVGKAPASLLPANFSDIGADLY